MTACIWSTATELDAYWVSAPANPVCMCVECYDHQRREPREFDLGLLADTAPAYRRAQRYVESWLERNNHSSISNHDEAEWLAAQIERDLRVDDQRLYRQVMRDSGFIMELLMRFADQL